jgi:hypothetical protein
MGGAEKTPADSGFRVILTPFGVILTHFGPILIPFRVIQGYRIVLHTYIYKLILCPSIEHARECLYKCCPRRAMLIQRVEVLNLATEDTISSSPCMHEGRRARIPAPQHGAPRRHIQARLRPRR